MPKLQSADVVLRVHQMAHSYHLVRHHSAAGQEVEDSKTRLTGNDQ